MQVVATNSPSVKQKIASHFDSMWNVFDIIILALFIAAVVLRMTLPDEQFFWARNVYTLDLTFFFIRFIQVFFVSKSMGPKVIILRGMVSKGYKFPSFVSK